MNSANSELRLYSAHLPTSIDVNLSKRIFDGLPRKKLLLPCFKIKRQSVAWQLLVKSSYLYSLKELRIRLLDKMRTRAVIILNEAYLEVRDFSGSVVAYD